MTGKLYQDRGKVFTDAYGKWIFPGLLGWHIKALRHGAGVERITLQSLRHFHASVVLQAGKDTVVVSKQLGHANLSFTSGHLSPRAPRLAEGGY